MSEGDAALLEGDKAGGEPAGRPSSVAAKGSLAEANDVVAVEVAAGDPQGLPSTGGPSFAGC
jgi:hypothetical protein